MDEQPFRVISTEEAQKLTGRSFGSSTDDEETIELGRRIWDLALQGKNRDQIARKLKISIEVLDNTLNAYRLRLGLSIDHYRMLDNERIDQVIAYWLPVATDPVKILTFQKGDPIVAEDFDRSMKAAYLVIQAMQNRIRILGATNALAGPGDAAGGLEGAKSYSERNIVIWLREVMPSIEKITREVEAEVVPQ
jgi:DNA-binding CsgD family transcriptional regulator